MNKIHRIEVPFEQEVTFSGILKKKINSTDDTDELTLKFEHKKLAGSIVITDKTNVNVKLRIHSLEKVSIKKLKKLIEEYEAKHKLNE